MSADLRIIGVPMDLGQSLRGVNMGPPAVRYAGLAARLRELGFGVEDAGNVYVPVREELAEQEAQSFLPAIVETCTEVYAWSREAIAEVELPIFLGGDHSISLGTIGGVTHDEPAGVVWIDAHGDFNVAETSPSGNVHGMVLAALVGDGFAELVELGRPGAKLRRRDVVMVGVRDLDPGERVRLRESGLRVYTMRDIDERGIAEVVAEGLGYLGHCQRLHVSLDLDSLDPAEAPGVGTPVPGGLSYREAQLLMEMLADDGRVRSVDVVEVNPILDERNRTARIAVQLLESLLGKAIL